MRTALSSKALKAPLGKPEKYIEHMYKIVDRKPKPHTSRRQAATVSLL
jgi:hypothetical protein